MNSRRQTTMARTRDASRSTFALAGGMRQPQRIKSWSGSRTDAGDDEADLTRYINSHLQPAPCPCAVIARAGHESPPRVVIEDTL